MTHDDAATLVGFLRSAPGWGSSITDDQAKFFADRLTQLNGAEGSKAILNGIKVWEYAPSWASVIELYKVERAKSQVEERVTHGYDLPPKSDIPLWVKRWLYARYIQSPPDLRPFREQHGYVDPDEEPIPDHVYVTEARSLTARQLNAAVQVAFGPIGQSDEQVIATLRSSLGLSAT